MIENAFAGRKCRDPRFPEAAQWVPQYTVEKILHERGQNNAAQDGQRLLMPLIVELTPGQQAVFTEISEELHRNGFEVELFGARTVAVKTAPVPRPVINPFSGERGTPCWHGARAWWDRIFQAHPMGRWSRAILQLHQENAGTAIAAC